MKKIILFMSLNNSSKLLLIEAFILLGWARILKKISFKKVAPILGKHMEETPFLIKEEGEINTLKLISFSVNLMSKYTFWESECLVKAIAAMKMLERRNIESTLYLGTAKDLNGKFIAHAWLRSGPLYITGIEGKEKFTVVGKFANSIRFKGAENG